MISDEELAKERIPLAARDYCAHLLVDLNRCRRRTLYLPFKCTEEKHEYEQCLYKEYFNLLGFFYKCLNFLFLVFLDVRKFSKIKENQKIYKNKHKNFT